jgi:predicted ATPase/class 3 adenylate cyclase
VSRSELPTGTVTFLFTDVEGSTKLLHELGAERYADALADHRRTLRGAFGTHGGVEVDTQGDALFVAFPSVQGALAAAEAGRHALALGRIRVRMGLHTGTPYLGDEGYVGSDVHLGARIAAAGHGGQILVSKATRDLVGGGLVDLGEHRLKDFEDPVWIFQLGDGEFPPLKTLSNTNLPRPASSFVGRERETAEVTALLLDGARLVTLAGPGGSGKTRLAVEVAAELVPAFRNGVFWVGLATVRDPGLVAQTIAQTLGARDGLADHIAERELLLLLDNFEQVVDAAPNLSSLLSTCPNLRLLVTSRERLRVHGEHPYPVPPLAGPEGVDLFCQRSDLAADETVAALCSQLDNLPLALELAAARASVLSPVQILERLSQRLDLLKGGRDADPRQKTLRATLAWSHDLLDEDERGLFARLAVFRGGCTLEAAEDVADATVDTLQSLVDKSLLRHTDERFWMLETIREYALERLAATAAEPVLRQRHAEHFVRVAEDARARYAGSPADSLARFSPEVDNFRSALTWARDAGEDDTLLRLAFATETYWGSRGFDREARAWLTLATRRATAPSELRLRALMLASLYVRNAGDQDEADALTAEALYEAERAGDQPRVLQALNQMASSTMARGKHEAAREQFIDVKEKADALGDAAMQSYVTTNLGLVDMLAGDFESALRYSVEAVELHRALGHTNGVIIAQSNCGWALLGLADHAGAAEWFRASLLVAGELGAVSVIRGAVIGLAAVYAARGDEEHASELLGAEARMREEIGWELDSLETRVLESTVVAARAALGDDAFDEAYARGEALTTDEVVVLCTDDASPFSV